MTQPNSPQPQQNHGMGWNAPEIKEQMLDAIAEFKTYGLTDDQGEDVQTKLGDLFLPEELYEVLEPLIQALIAKQVSGAAARDHKFITEIIHRLDDSQDNLVDFEGAMGMLKDWQDELASLTHTEEKPE